jgi:hypothetical protein
MKNLRPIGGRHALSVAAVATLFAVGCGGETYDITAAVADTNRTLKENKATIDCPSEVDGPVGTKFDCTLKGDESGKTAPVKLEIIKDGIETVDEKAFGSALERVTS